MSGRRHGLLVNKKEQEILRVLERVGGYKVWPKVRMTDVIDDQDYPWNSVQRDFMRKAHFDFVLTEPTDKLKPMAAIELDGPSHEHDAQKRRDDLKNEICSLAGLPLFRFVYPEIEESLHSDWVGHVIECWKWDLRNCERSSDEREQGFPLCWFLAAVKACHTRNETGAVLNLEVLEQTSYECTHPGCKSATGIARVRIMVSGREAIGNGSASSSVFPLSQKMLMWLALDLAEYDALKSLGLIHSPCGVVAPCVQYRSAE